MQPVLDYVGQYTILAKYTLAIPYQKSNINNNILLLDLDVNGDFIPNSEKFISLPYNSTTGLDYAVHGLEFSPNGRYLYFTGKTNGLPGLGVFNYVNLLDTTLTPVPLALSTNSDFQYSHIELGLDGKINIYPNPAHNKIYINGLSADTNYAVKIMDINGKIWLQTELGKDAGLNISGLKSGLYVIQIQSDREIKRTQSIVKIE